MKLRLVATLVLGVAVLTGCSDSPKLAGSAVVVNGKVILASEVAERVDKVRAQIQVTDPTLIREVPSLIQINQRAVDHFVLVSLLEEVVAREGINITDLDVAAYRDEVFTQYAKETIEAQLVSQNAVPADDVEHPVELIPNLDNIIFDFKKIITKTKKEIWGIGIGLPGPVEFAAGIPMSPPIVPGWDRYPVRERLSKIFNAPVWVDNDVNLMALGEVAKNHEKKYNELIYIKIGSGIGAGILTHGRLHRGAQGCAGDIGHIAVAGIADVVCRCGNVGCLEAVAGGIAIARDALSAVENGKSAYLRDCLKVNKKIEASDVIEGAKSGDKWCVDAINAAGQQVGKILATLVNFHNPPIRCIFSKPNMTFAIDKCSPYKGKT